MQLSASGTRHSGLRFKQIGRQRVEPLVAVREILPAVGAPARWVCVVTFPLGYS
jgi:hypothetical protein